jgi:hypothetical protein
MIELEIKHLSAYLPYGLKMQGIESSVSFHYKLGNFVLDLRGLSIGGNGNLVIEMKRKADGHFEFADYEIRKSKESLVKPILWPMSDVGSEVVNEILTEFPNSPNFESFWSEWMHSQDLSQTTIEWCVFDKLCSMKFDVFRLIDKGLAVSVHNLVANPYN